MSYGTTFDLLGDGDDVEVLEEIETIFGIDIEDSEAEKLFKFQELVDLVEAKLEPTNETTCLAMHAFRRLRDAGALPASLSRPSASLEKIIGSADPSEELAKLSKSSGIDLSVSTHARPLLGISSWYWYCGSALCAFLVAMIIGSVWAMFIWVIVASLAIVYWPGQLPIHLRTLADLLRQNLPNNYNRLRSEFGSGNAADRRIVIESICREFACYSGPVTAETTFIKNRSFF